MNIVMNDIAKEMLKSRIEHNPEIIKCCICGDDLYTVASHNPYPLTRYSYYGENKCRCCADCNSRYVIKARTVLTAASRKSEKDFKNIEKQFRQIGIPKAKQVLDIMPLHITAPAITNAEIFEIVPKH